MPTAREAFVARAVKRRKYAQNVSKFATLKATPFDFTGGEELTLPADALLAISFDGAVEAGEFEIVLGGVTYGTPDLAENQLHRLPLARAGSVVTMSSSIT